MKCENDKTQLARWINNEMTETERAAFEVHLTQCTECRQEMEADQQVWDLMGEISIPEPSAAMRLKFHAMLDTYKESQEEWKSPFADIMQMFKRLWSVQPAFQLAYSFVLVVVGLGLGYLINHRSDGNKEIVALSSQVHEMREMMMLSLLENPSASERIRGVGYTSEISGGNKQVIEALFTTLNNDPNVNVRLITLEALTQLAKNPVVREGLVQSIMQQESPLLQSALADVMLKLQEKRSVQPFKKLLQQKDLNNQVRGKIEETITGLI